jgi:molecular chaperone GrpE
LIFVEKSESLMMSPRDRAIEEQENEQQNESRAELPEGSDDGDSQTVAADGNGAPVAAPEQDAVKKLQAERDALFDRVARQQAEFDNYRKRVSREQADFRDYAVVDPARSLIQILDSLDLALKAPHKGDDSDLRKGIDLIRKQMEEALTKMGARPIPSVGEPFDPHLHEAIEMVETSDVKDNHVIEELQRGYKIKDRLLRPSMVRVARNPKK